MNRRDRREAFSGLYFYRVQSDHPLAGFTIDSHGIPTRVAQHRVDAKAASEITLADLQRARATLDNPLLADTEAGRKYVADLAKLTDA